MMGKRKPSGTLFDVGNVFPLVLPPGTFHAQLAEAGPRLFPDKKFQELYDPTRGRYSVPPSELALLLLLKAQADCSDAEAWARSAFDLRWCAVLRKPAGEPLCAKSTFQAFRATLVVKQQDCLLQASLSEAQRCGLLGRGELRLFIDTKPVLGWGAVKDTYNLLGDGIAQLTRALARVQGQDVTAWAAVHGLQRYLADRTSSLKGGADLDWTQAQVRQEFLGEIVADALRVCQLAQAWLATAPQGSPEANRQRRAVEEPCTLLEQILGQDVKVQTGSDGGLTAELKEGTAPDRICSSTDPDQRHGHKSKSKRFNGHKVRIGVVRRRRVKLVVGVDMLPGNAGDAAGLKQLVEQVEANTGQAVGESVGDCAFGGGETRQEFADAERVLLAKSPQPSARGELFPKSAFTIDLEAGTVTCPAGHVRSTCTETKDGTRHFRFGALCATCPLRDQCTTAKGGRTVQVHPQEQLLQAARAFQDTPAGKALLRERSAVEHALAMLAHLGAGQARYRGREKTHFQMQGIAAVVNLRQIWNWEATAGPTGPASTGDPDGVRGPQGAPESAGGAKGWLFSLWTRFRSVSSHGSRGRCQPLLSPPPGWSMAVAH